MIMVSIFLLIFSFLSYGLPIDSEANEFLVHYLPVKSYAGQIPIERPGQNVTVQKMFFWYFPPAQETFGDTPLILWVQGGPGSSSMIGLFAEHGPLEFVNGQLSIRADSWNERYGVLYVDNPVGTGYSTVKGNNPQDCMNRVYNDDEPLYCGPFAVNQLAVAEDMKQFLLKFYSLFPQLNNSPLFISGESYAGKYVPNIASALLREDSINFKGVMIGDGLIDPPSQIHVSAEQALYFGLVSPNQAKVLRNLSSEAIIASEKHRYLEAADFRNKMFEDLEEFSGGLNLYDIRKEKQDNPWENIQQFMELDSTKRALHVSPDSTFSVRSPIVRQIFHGDVFKSSLSKLDLLLENGIPVLIFAGQYDIRDGIPGQYSVISNLKWSKKSNFFNTSRLPWMDGTRIIGYTTSYDELSFVELRQAGHLAPMDQTQYCKEMIYQFIEKNLF